MLTYVVEAALAGRGADIKEYSLGVAVFARGEDFDSRIDPIVRVQARKLRSRLRQYYRSQGSADPVRIEIPEGSYTPVFQFRETGGALPAPAPVEAAANRVSTAPFAVDTTRTTLGDDPAFRLIGLIYDAAQNPRYWPDFLRELADVVHGHATGLLAHDYLNAETNVAASVRLDPVFQSEFDEYYHKVDLWTIRGRQYLKPGIIFIGQVACSDEELLISEFYNDYLRKAKLFHSIGGTISKQENRGSFVTSVRPRAAGPFSEKEIRVFRVLLPHLQRALDLHRTLVSLEGERDAGAGALDALPYGCILLDGAGQVLRANRIAVGVLDQNDGLQLAAGRLTAAGREQTNELQQLIADAAKTALGKGLSPGGTMCIHRPSGRRSYTVAVSPVSSGTFLLGRRQAFIAVFVSDPEEAPSTREEILGRLFRLTPAEARLGALLVQGYDCREAADRLAITETTARTHIRRLLEKTGTNRQAELVRVFLSTPFVPAGSKPLR